MMKKTFLLGFLILVLTLSACGSPGSGGSGSAVSSLEDAQSAVIQIESQGSFVDPEVGMVYNAGGRGSGFIIDPSGIAITNNHVVTGAALIQVWVGGSDEPLNARILGVSECSDLALIDIEGDGFPYLEWYEGELSVGTDVYAAGFPLGDPEFTLTRGIIAKASADGESSWSSVDNVIMHDANINPGNSGGPLITANGQVVGVNYMGSQELDQFFAISRDEALRVIDILQTGEDYLAIGLNGQAVRGESLSGIWINSVRSGSPADIAGIQGGDILLTIEDLILATDGTMSAYCDILRTHAPTDVLDVQVLRYAEQRILEGQINGRQLAGETALAQPTQPPAQAAAPTQAPAPTSIPPTAAPVSLIPSNLRPITLTNMNRLQPLVELSYAGVYNPAFSPDGRYLSLHLGGISGLDRYGTLVVDLISGEEVFASDDPSLDTTFSQDSSSIYIIDERELRLFNLRTGQQSVLLQADDLCAAVSPDGRWLATIEADAVSQDSIIHVIDLRSGNERHALPVDSIPMQNLIWFTADSEMLIAGYGFNNSSVAGYGIYTFWDVESGERENILTGYASIAVDPGSNYIAATVLDRGTISILDITDLEVIRYFGISGEQRISRPAFTPDGELVYFIDDGDIFFWDPRSGEDLGALDLPDDIGWHIFSDNMTLFAATDPSHHITLWGVMP